MIFYPFTTHHYADVYWKRFWSFTDWKNPAQWTSIVGMDNRRKTQHVVSSRCPENAALTQSGDAKPMFSVKISTAASQSRAVSTLRA